MDNGIKEAPKEAAFNAAIATLMRLDRILIDIKDNSIAEKRTKGKKQHYKYRLVKAFYVQSVPLIKDKEDKDLIKKKLLAIKLIYREVIAWNNYTTPKYIDEIENELDDILILIQEALQKGGHFMPEKRDTGL